jgi:peptidyl-prolyl cis-trans isomerase SurA
MRTPNVLPVLAASLTILCLRPTSARAEIVDGIAVVVNGDIITRAEVTERIHGAETPIPPGTIKRAAEEAATEHLVDRECAEQGFTATPAEIENSIEDVRRENGNIDMKTLERAMQAQGLTLERYRQEVGHQLCRMKVIDAKVKPRVNVGEDDIKAAFTHIVGKEKPIEEAFVRDIYVPSDEGTESARQKVVAAQKRLASGEDFIKVATETGGPFAAEGGKLGWMKETEIAPELKVAFALPNGFVSPIIETSTGFHLLKVFARRQSSTMGSYAELHDKIKQQLQGEKLEKAASEYLAELRRTADIEYHLE